jgi:TonB family protein
MGRAAARLGGTVNRANGILIPLLGVAIAVGAGLNAAGCGGAKPAAVHETTVAPPVAAQPMPPIPDLSNVRTFTRPIIGVLTSGVGVQPATLVQLGELKYPPEAWNRGLQGWAVFDFVVGANGSVDGRYVRLVAVSDSIFRKPAEAAVRAARFTPAIYQGKPAPMLLRLPVRFWIDQTPRRD